MLACMCAILGFVDAWSLTYQLTSWSLTYQLTHNLLLYIYIYMLPFIYITFSYTSLLHQFDELIYHHTYSIHNNRHMISGLPMQIYTWRIWLSNQLQPAGFL
jgi:hypothetical protein